jgi:predicted esterase
MTTPTKIYEKFSAGLELAYLEGRAKEHLDDFFKAMAVDFANTVFLKMEAEVAKMTEETVDQYWRWIQEFPYDQGLSLIESVKSSMAQYQASELQIKEAQTLTANAYQEQLNFLFENSQAGGAA